jgi:hypothetical protein
LKGRLTSAMKKSMLFVWKFSGVLNVTGREIQPHGINDTKPTPENGCEGYSFDIGICSFLKLERLMRLRAAPPSIRMLLTFLMQLRNGTELSM